MTPYAQYRTTGSVYMLLQTRGFVSNGATWERPIPAGKLIAYLDHDCGEFVVRVLPGNPSEFAEAYRLWGNRRWFYTAADIGALEISEFLRTTFGV